MHRVIAVIVTMLRPRELEDLLSSLERQQRPPDSVILVENLPHAETAEVVARHPGVRHLVSQRNLGGAGGFAYGIYAALADGATHVWLMDDDGLPLEPTCLARLIEGADQHRADVVSPVILDIDNGARLAFPYFDRGKRLKTRADLQGIPVIWNFAHLFNGALVRADAFNRFGVPDYRLFLRGDEVNFLHSVRRGGGLVITLTDVAFRHPSGDSETIPLLGGRLHAVVPPQDFKQFVFFRNRGYLLRRHKLGLQALSDIVRYPWYYLVVRKGDWAGLKRWYHLLKRGYCEDFRTEEAPAAPLTAKAAPDAPKATRERP